MKIGVLIYPNVQPLDAIGPWEVFSTWQRNFMPSCELVLVSESGGLIECDNSIVLKSHVDFLACGHLDLLLVPGGYGRIQQVHNVNLIEFIRQQYSSGAILASVCTGMFLVAQSGVLNGELVTTYWRAINEFSNDFAVQISPQRVVKSGKIWSCGGVTSGIDLALELISDISGREVMDKVRLLLEYFPSSANDCQLDLANDLPAYVGEVKNSQADLPKYILN